MYHNEAPSQIIVIPHTKDFWLKYGKISQAKANEFPTFQEGINKTLTPITINHQ